MKVHWEKIHPDFPESSKGEFVENVVLIGIEATENKVVKSKVDYLLDGRFIISFSNFINQISRPSKSRKFEAFFLSFKFRSSAIKHLPGFKYYDFDSPWNLQIGIYDDRDRDNLSHVDKAPRFCGNKVVQDEPRENTIRLKIMRHQEFGEVPNFRWRSESEPAEFQHQI